MNPSAPPSYQKIDNDAPCIFDFPGEVRNRIYFYYFAVSGRRSIHLLNMPESYRNQHSGHFNGYHNQMGGLTYHKAPVARISSTHHSHVPVHAPGKGADFTVFRIIEKKVDGTFVENETEDEEKVNLLLACRAIRYEAGISFEDGLSSFNVVSELGAMMHYHRDLGCIPGQVLTRIRALSVDSSVFKSTADITNQHQRATPKHEAWWTCSNWQLVLQNMYQLRHLSITDLDIREIFCLFRILSKQPTIFIGETTITRFFITAIKNRPAPNAFIGMAQPFEREGPRVIIPPLTTLTLMGSMDEGQVPPKVARTGFEDWMIWPVGTVVGKKCFEYSTFRRGCYP